MVGVSSYGKKISARGTYTLYTWDYRNELTAAGTGHATTVPKFIAAQDIIRGEEKHVVRLTYTAEAEGEPELDYVEHTEYRWVTFEELSVERDLDMYVRDLLDDGILTDIL